MASRATWAGERQGPDVEEVRCSDPPPAVVSRLYGAGSLGPEASATSAQHQPLPTWCPHIHSWAHRHHGAVSRSRTTRTLSRLDLLVCVAAYAPWSALPYLGSPWSEPSSTSAGRSRARPPLPVPSPSPTASVSAKTRPLDCPLITVAVPGHYQAAAGSRAAVRGRVPVPSCYPPAQPGHTQPGPDSDQPEAGGHHHYAVSSTTAPACTALGRLGTVQLQLQPQWQRPGSLAPLPRQSSILTLDFRLPFSRCKPRRVSRS